MNSILFQKIEDNIRFILILNQLIVSDYHTHIHKTYRPGTMSDLGDQLWDPGQEWIQIFDNLLKHPQECQLFWCRIATCGLLNFEQVTCSF